MMEKKIVNTLTELIGHTPMLHPANYSQANALQGTLLLKLESFNPSGSVKDRAAFALIESAEQKGLIHEGSILVESTSGNTGIGLAFVAASKGYRLLLTMPDTMSIERQNLLKALGAELILTPGAQGMKGAIAKADELVATMQHAIRLQQFADPANPSIHERTTALEIWEATKGEVDVVVAGIGTGGTISGIGRGLKALRSDIEVIGVEPVDSPVITTGVAGPHKIQGIGAGFIPSNYHADVVDRVETVTFDQAVSASRMLAKKEGLLAGISSGAALAIATELARQEAYKDKKIVVILPDTGERYLSTLLYAYEAYPLD